MNIIAHIIIAFILAVATLAFLVAGIDTLRGER